MSDTETEKKAPVGRVTLYNVRLSFAELWEARSFEGADGRKSKARRKANFLIPKSEAKHPKRAKFKGELMSFAEAIRRAKIAAIAEKIGMEKARVMVKKIKPDAYAVRDGDLETWDGYEGQYYVSAGNTRKVQTVHRDKTPVTEEDGVLYSGCYVNAVLTFWFQKAGKTADGQPLSNAVWCTLEAVQYYDKGDAFGASSVDAEEEFDDVSGEFDDPVDGDTDPDADDFDGDDNVDDLL